jgi:glycerophosphoryl diester phosphodiesterase
MTAFFSSPFLVIAHRGASAEAPENTLPAFARALAVGAPAVELDVYAAHGELWVIHDDALDRTTNGTGRWRITIQRRCGASMRAAAPSSRP